MSKESPQASGSILSALGLSIFCGIRFCPVFTWIFSLGFWQTINASLSIDFDRINLKDYPRFDEADLLLEAHSRADGTDLLKESCTEYSGINLHGLIVLDYI